MNRINHSSRFIEQFSKYGQSRKLGDVVKLMDDRRKPINDAERQSMKTGELYPYYGATGQVDSINSYLTDDTLLCIAEDCGNYKGGEESSYIITGKAWVNNHAHLVKPNEDCDITFLHYYLTISDLSPYVTGTTRQKLTQKSLVSIPVVTPPVEEQKAFVSIVLQADKSKFNGFKSRFFELMQVGYTQKSLCSICRPRQWPTIQTKDFTNDGYLVYGANGIIGRYREYNHEDRTILMACRGASCGAINISEPKSYITGNAMCLDELSDEINFDFLAYFLSCYDYSQIITGGAQPQITYTNLTKVLVPVPDMTDQDSFVIVLQQADKSKYLN